MKKIVSLTFVSVLLVLTVVAPFLGSLATESSLDGRVNFYFAEESKANANSQLTVTETYGESTFYSTNSDTFISSGSGSDYEALRVLSEGAAKFDDENFIYVGQKNVPEYCIWRAFVYFDTSSIPDDVVIVSAELSLYGSGKYTDLDYNVTVQNGQPTYPHDPAELGDYALSHYTGNGGMFDTSDFVFGYNNITLNADGRSWINKAGITKLCLRSSRDINANPPAPNLENVQFWASEMGEGYKPKLHVTWAIYVDDDNTAGPWDGTPEHPYQSITSALQQVSVNGIIYVYSGTYFEHVVVDKAVRLVGENKTTTVIDGNETAEVIKITVNNVTVTGFTVQKSATESAGIEVLSSYNSIIDNIVSMNFYGIVLDASGGGNIVSDNVVLNNSRWGIHVKCNNNLVIHNTVSLHYDGIRIEGSDNTIAYNFLSDNAFAIYAMACRNNVVSNNEISNSAWGIDFHRSNDSVVVGNTVSNSRVYGIGVAYSCDNTVYHNNFISNLDQVFIFQSSNNRWDNGYPSGGNFWSNYLGLDLHSGANQDLTGSDGIGDEPYLVDDYQDTYPIMRPINFFNAGTWDEVTYYVRVASNSTVSDFYFTKDDKQVSFNVTGQEETVGFCRVAIPKSLMWCLSLEEWNVTVNDNPPMYLKTLEDADHTYLYFTYSQTLSNIKVTSTHVIGEAHPSPPFWVQWWFWATLVIVTLVTVGAIYFLRRKKSPTPVAPSPSPESSGPSIG